MTQTTEQRNPASENLDTLSTQELVELINREDAAIASVVGGQSVEITAAIDLLTVKLGSRGRLIYIGAGTSGRLGVLDASECPPTFNADPEDVIGIIAGGDFALRNAVEGAEDSPEAGATDLRALKLNDSDVVAGIAASGGTPYVIGALEYANELGASTIAITCNADSPLGAIADIDIALVVGPEILSGSTRMKSGTATKMVLNMLSTGVMIRLGKTYGNLMVDLRASNRKLVERATRIVCLLTDLDAGAAKALLTRCDGELKTAIVCERLNLSPGEARSCLGRAGGRLREALENASC